MVICSLASLGIILTPSSEHCSKQAVQPKQSSLFLTMQRPSSSVSKTFTMHTAEQSPFPLHALTTTLKEPRGQSVTSVRTVSPRRRLLVLCRLVGSLFSGIKGSLPLPHFLDVLCKGLGDCISSMLGHEERRRLALPGPPAEYPILLSRTKSDSVASQFSAAGLNTTDQSPLSKLYSMSRPSSAESPKTAGSLFPLGILYLPREGTMICRRPGPQLRAKSGRHSLRSEGFSANQR